MNDYLLILKMISKMEPHHRDVEYFPGQITKKVCPTCNKIIEMAKLAVESSNS